MTGLKDYGRKLTEDTRKDLLHYFKDKDYMVITVPEKEPFRLYTVKTTNTVKVIERIHQPPIMAKAVMAKLVTGTLLLTSLIKHASNQKILVKVETKGPIRLVAVEADGYGRTRAFIDVGEDIEIHTKNANGRKKFDLSKILLPGDLIVVKDIGIGEPYTTILPLVSGEISEDIAYYLYKSEQIPSAVATGVLIGESGEILHAGGFLLQPLGNVSNDILVEFENRVKNLPPVTELMQEGNRPEDIAIKILDGLNPYIVGLKEISFYCPCNIEIIKDFLKNLPEEEKRDLSKNNYIEVTCNYCKSIYRIREDELCN